MWNPTLGVECLYRYDYAFPSFFPPNISNDYFVLCWQAKRAVQRGATAVIFDVSENPDAIDQVCTHRELLRHSRSQQHWNSLICLGLSVKDSPLFISEWSLAACPALLAGSVWVCVCVQTMIFLSLVLFKSTRISLAHSAIPGLSSLPTCVWRSALHSVRTENWYPGSAFTRPWPNSVELTIAQVAYFTSPPESVLWVQV